MSSFTQHVTEQTESALRHQLVYLKSADPRTAEILAELQHRRDMRRAPVADHFEGMRWT